MRKGVAHRKESCDKGQVMLSCQVYTSRAYLESNMEAQHCPILPLVTEQNIMELREICVCVAPDFSELASSQRGINKETENRDDDADYHAPDTVSDVLVCNLI